MQKILIVEDDIDIQDILKNHLIDELGVCRGWIAEVGGNGPQLFRVQAIVKAVFQALQGRPLIGPLVGFEVGCGRRHPSFPYDKRRMGSAAVFCIFWPP